eukprot:Gregarina_sp_Pseudo_9__3788@NODE_393_length_2942_cov_5_810885_g370_i0_p1_GENE_NODE_393_length_2942_cov_5_810885_g370_i0NODE_393_length_2942_cov_5_810885_g370_i0_p1_ORF_typecomplete_len633_score79_85Evr1_Alr/PF04777_13/1_2e12Thioredoxin/PF00085_20/0_007TraF/PF13728_6/0_27_NODE_393_length_2942_cov_5_810885_g370_i06512549
MRIFFLPLFALYGRAAVSLFERDRSVREIRTPVELRQFVQYPAYLPDTTELKCIGSRLLLLYNGLCSHCHAFAPVWSAFGRRLDCAQNEAVKFAAFECSSSSVNRSSSIDEWAQVFKSEWNVSQNYEGSPENMITPLTACRLLVPRSYPTVLVSVAPGCTLDQEFKNLREEHDENLDSILGPKIRLHMWPKRLSMAASELTDVLAQAGLVTQCPGFANRQQQDKALVNYLFASRGLTRVSNVTRWSESARRINPDWRLHDALLGIHQILGSWAFHDADTLSRTELTGLMNFLLVVMANIPDRRSKQSIMDLLTSMAQQGAKLTRRSYLDLLNDKLFLMGVAPPSQREDLRPEAKLCESNSCAIWTAFHVFASIDYYKSSKARTRQCVPLFQAENFSVFGEQVAKLSKLAPDDLAQLCVGGKNTAEAMHQLIYNFFNCNTCRGHFHDAYEGCVADRCTWVSANPIRLQALLRSHGGRDLKATEDLGFMLWLWRFHNIVNSRTATEKSLSNLRKQFDENAPNLSILYINQDFQVPLAEDCRTCRRALAFPAASKTVTVKSLLTYLQNNEDESKMDFDSSSVFHLSEVARYLMRFYFDSKWLAFPSVVWNPSAESFIEESLIQSLPGSGRKAATF